MLSSAARHDRVNPIYQLKIRLATPALEWVATITLTTQVTPSFHSGNSIRSECFLSRSCSSASTLSSQCACLSASDLSTNAGS
jgi:hypothetical protein